MSPEIAQTIALQALAWLVSNEDICATFLGSTGTSVEDLRTRTGDTEFQVSVLEFLTMDDSWVVAFCDEINLGYDMPLKARYSLPNAEKIHWT